MAKSRVQDYEGALEALHRARQIRARPLPSGASRTSHGTSATSADREALVVVRQLWTAPNRSEGEMTTLMAGLSRLSLAVGQHHPRHDRYRCHPFSARRKAPVKVVKCGEALPTFCAGK